MLLPKRLCYSLKIFRYSLNTRKGYATNTELCNLKYIIIMTTKIFKAVLGIAFISFFGTQSISAQSQGERKEPPTATELMKQMDADEDGKLSKDEVKGPLKDDFADIDTDEDGYISTKELEDAPKPKGKGPKRD